MRRHCADSATSRSLQTGRDACVELLSATASVELLSATASAQAGLPQQTLCWLLLVVLQGLETYPQLAFELVRVWLLLAIVNSGLEDTHKAGDLLGVEAQLRKRISMRRDR